MNKILNVICIFTLTLLLIPSVSALQQTSGAINLSVEPGNSITGKYGIRNDDSNNSVNVKFNVTGDASEFIIYEKIITLKPNEFRYVNVTATISKDYSGNNNLKAIIYALKEGNSGGQVQLDIRLGKYINLNIENQNILEKIPKNDNIPKSGDFMSTFMFIGIILTIYVMIKRK